MGFDKMLNFKIKDDTNIHVGKKYLVNAQM